MNVSRHIFLTMMGFSMALCLSAQPSWGQPDAVVLSSDQIARIVGSPDRSAADRTNDLRRKPEQMLAFMGIRAGMVVLDVSAAGGYTTELLARSVGPTGRVYGQSQPRDANQPPTPPAQREGNSHPSAAPAPAAAPVGPSRASPVALIDRDTSLREAGIPAAPIIPISRPFADPLPAELASDRLDLVTLMFNYHDLGHLGVDRAAMNTAIFKALKP